jgi:hypothetical protein
LFLWKVLGAFNANFVVMFLERILVTMIVGCVTQRFYELDPLVKRIQARFLSFWIVVSILPSGYSSESNSTIIVVKYLNF